MEEVLAIIHWNGYFLKPILLFKELCQVISLHGISWGNAGYLVTYISFPCDIWQIVLDYMVLTAMNVPWPNLFYKYIQVNFYTVAECLRGKNIQISFSPLLITIQILHVFFVVIFYFIFPVSSSNYLPVSRKIYEITVKWIKHTCYLKFWSKGQSKLKSYYQTYFWHHLISLVLFKMWQSVVSVLINLISDTSMKHKVLMMYWDPHIS